MTDQKKNEYQHKSVDTEGLYDEEHEGNLTFLPLSYWLETLHILRTGIHWIGWLILAML